MAKVFPAECRRILPDCNSGPAASASKQAQPAPLFQSKERTVHHAEIKGFQPQRITLPEQD